MTLEPPITYADDVTQVIERAERAGRLVRESDEHGRHRATRPAAATVLPVRAGRPSPASSARPLAPLAAAELFPGRSPGEVTPSFISTRGNNLRKSTAKSSPEALGRRVVVLPVRRHDAAADPQRERRDRLLETGTGRGMADLFHATAAGLEGRPG